MAELKLKNGLRLVGGIFVVTVIVVMVLSGGALVGHALMALTILTVGTPIYFIPSFAANRRGHPQLRLIFLLNLLLGWTVIGREISTYRSVDALERGIMRYGERVQKAKGK
jgi:hypothetical protein